MRSPLAASASCTKASSQMSCLSAHLEWLKLVYLVSAPVVRLLSLRIGRWPPGDYKRVARNMRLDLAGTYWSAE